MQCMLRNQEGLPETVYPCKPCQQNKEQKFSPSLPTSPPPPLPPTPSPSPSPPPNTASLTATATTAATTKTMTTTTATTTTTPPPPTKVASPWGTVISMAGRIRFTAPKLQDIFKQAHFWPKLITGPSVEPHSPVKKSNVMNLEALKLFAAEPFLSTKQVCTRRMHPSTFFLLFWSCCLFCVLTCSCPNRFSTNQPPNPPTHLLCDFCPLFLLSHVWICTAFLSLRHAHTNTHTPMWWNQIHPEDHGIHNAAHMGIKAFAFLFKNVQDINRHSVVNLVVHLFPPQKCVKRCGIFSVVNVW